MADDDSFREPWRKATFTTDDLIANTMTTSTARPVVRPLAMLTDVADLATGARNSIPSLSRVVPVSERAATPVASGRAKPAITPIPVENADPRSSAASSSHIASVRNVLADRRVVKHGFSMPIIFALSVAIGVSYSLAMMKPSTVEWLPQDLTGDREWTSTTRTHLAQDPLVFLDELFRNTSIGDDTSVSVEFLAKYSKSVEAHAASTAKTFNATWLDSSFILGHGFAIAGIMAGSFEGYALWPCALALPKYPTLLQSVCTDPQKSWFTVEIFNNLVATTSEKASTYLSLSYTPMSLMSTRVWEVTPPQVTPTGVVMRGYKEGTYAERQYWLLKTEREQLGLTRVVACDSSTQSNALECDRLEKENVFVRNVATRDFEPPSKMDKIKVYGPAYAMGNFVAAGKTFVQLPASAIMMTSTGYSATTRFSTTIPFRLTIDNGKLKTESNVYQVASCTDALGNGFALATVQMVIVCMIVYNAIAHCQATEQVVASESRIFGFKNYVTMGTIARRLGTYKLVFVQLCLYHALNVGRYFSAVYYNTQKFTDTIAFGAEGFLLVVVCTMLVDQALFFEKYSSSRETLTVVGSCSLYLVFLYLQATYFISIHQVQVTELSICAGANQCTVVDGLYLYYIGIVAVQLVPVAIVNGPVHWFLRPMRSKTPLMPVSRDQMTTFEKFCLGIDARREFGSFDRSSGTTPISIVHAAGFTYVGSYLVRIKDYYMIVLVRHLPVKVVESCGLTLTVFRMRDGRVVSGQHMALIAGVAIFREAKKDAYGPIR